MSKPPEDRCECRGQCARHDKRCTTFLGNAHLFDGHADEPMYSPRGKGKRLCAQCAPGYDPYRRARERKAERATTEAPAQAQQEGEGIIAWMRRTGRAR